MVTAIPAPTQKTAEFQPVMSRRRWTRDEYSLMGEQGIIAPEERVELIDGEVVQILAPIGNGHRDAVDRVAEVFRDFLGKNNYIPTQSPFAVSEYSELVPDVIIMSGPRANFAGKPLTPLDTLLIIEISDSTLPYDRSKKALLYAAAGVSEYWVVNLKERKLEIYQSPEKELGYQHVVSATQEESVSPLFAPEFKIVVSQLFSG